MTPQITPACAASRADGARVIRSSSSGFSLVELLVALTVFGLLLAVVTPGFKRFQESQALVEAREQIARQLAAARQKAIATGTTQEVRFMYDFGGTSDYHIWSNSVASPSWRLPRNITYYWGSGTQNTYRMTSDGRCQDFGWIILQTSRGQRDTVAVRTSGMIFAY
jgi:prepilin-type N-terminal cleavage/methylation domain-containing protein